MLSLPYRLRYQLAWNHDLCREVIAVTMRAILTFLHDQAREAGIADPRGGAVVIVQRFGGAVNLNLHFHILALDGVFVPAGDHVRFRPLASLASHDVADVLATIVPGVGRLLSRRGVGDDAGDADGALDPWAETAPVLAGVAAASVQGRVALGPRAGLTLRRRGRCTRRDRRLGARSVPRPAGRLRSAGRRPDSRGPPGHPGAHLHIRAASPGGHRPPPADPRRARAPRTQTALVRWHDPSGVRPARTAGALGSDHPKAAHQPRAVLRRARRPVRVADADCPDSAERRAVLQGPPTITSVGVTLVGVDASQLWVRCAGLRSLRRAPASTRDHRATRRHSADLESPRIADRDSSASVRARSTAPSRRPSPGRSCRPPVRLRRVSPDRKASPLRPSCVRAPLPVRRMAGAARPR